MSGRKARNLAQDVARSLAMWLALSPAMALGLPLAAQAKTHALVIGINDYPAIVSLDGAVNDARDIDRALRDSGAENVTLLIDGQATRDAIIANWQRMLAQAAPGDTLILSFAGHGAQIEARDPGSESDGRDEFFLLSGFDPKDLRGSLDDMIFDDELRIWFEEAAQRDVKVLFIADSCHSGGMTRAPSGKLRFVDIPDDPAFRTAAGASLKGGRLPEGAAVTDSELSGVTLLAATMEGNAVPEVVIDGKARGALSWSVARAFEGFADRNADGRLSRLELEDYVREGVRTRSDALQSPVFRPAAAQAADAEIAAIAPSQVAMRTLAAARKEGPGGRFLRAADLGWKPVLPLRVKGGEEQPKATGPAALAYVWDSLSREVRSPNGEVVAQKIGAFTIDDVVAKFILVDLLTRLSQQNPATITLRPLQQAYEAGDVIRFDTEAGRYRNVLVFNLASTGEVQFLDMLINGKRTGTGWLRQIKVVPPFGADHLVVIATNEPLEAIGEAIRGGLTPADLTAMITERLDGRDVSVAVQPLFTRDKP